MVDNGRLDAIPLAISGAIPSGSVPVAGPMPGDAACGVTATAAPRGIAAIRADIRLSDSGDPWGSVMGWLFAACDVLNHYGEYGLIPSEAGYRCAMAGPDVDAYEFELFAELLDSDTVTADDVAYWARVLNRAADVLRMMGRDY